MKINEIIISENIDRRGFLKATAAAAIGGTGTNAKAKEYTVIICRMLSLYYICKELGLTGSKYNRIQLSLSKFSARNDMGPGGKTKGSTILNYWYRIVIDDMNKIKKAYPNQEDFENKLIKIWSQFDEIVSDFDSLMEFK
jgi:hypothetical protein